MGDGPEDDEGGEEDVGEVEEDGSSEGEAEVEGAQEAGGAAVGEGQVEDAELGGEGAGVGFDVAALDPDGVGHDEAGGAEEGWGTSEEGAGGAVEEADGDGGGGGADEMAGFEPLPVTEGGGHAQERHVEEVAGGEVVRQELDVAESVEVDHAGRAALIEAQGEEGEGEGEGGVETGRRSLVRPSRVRRSRILQPPARA